MHGVCVNHKCSRFEYVVEADSEDARCPDCGQYLCHQSGLTWGDARAKAVDEIKQRCQDAGVAIIRPTTAEDGDGRPGLLVVPSVRHEKLDTLRSRYVVRAAGLCAVVEVRSW